VDEQCRITVVGERRRADLAVPAAAPIASYVTALARVCGQGGDPVLLSAWSLGPAIGSPFAPERSLGELGILDGSVLYLRDVVEDEFSDPVVYDVAERVAEVAERRLHRRWTARARTVTVLAVGLGWLVAALAVLAVRHQIGHALVAELALLFGLVLPVIGWWPSAGRDSVPPLLREAVALSAVPLLAVAAWALSASQRFSSVDGAHGHLTHGGLAVVALVAGALAGALVAYVAAPAPATFTVLLTAVIAALTGIGLAVAKADARASATVTAVIAFALLTVVAKLAAWIVAFVDRQHRPRGAEKADRDADPVATAVDAAATVLIAWSGFLAVVLAVTLVPMACSRSPYAAAAAGCLGLGLLLRAGAARLTAEVVPLLVAGGAALLTLLVFGPGNLGWPSWVSPAGLIAIAVILIVTGFRRLMRTPDLSAAARPGWFGGFGSMLGGGGVALAIAALGTFGHLVSLGHRL